MWPTQNSSFEKYCKNNIRELKKVEFYDFKDAGFVSIIDANAAQAGRAYCTSFPACLGELKKGGQGTKDSPFDVSRLYNLPGVKEHHVLIPQSDDKGQWEKYHFKKVGVTKREDGIAPLALAAYLCKPHMVSRLARMRHHLNCQSKDGATPLIEAIGSNTQRQQDRLETIRTLLSNGASANIHTKQGHTALTVATWRGDVAVVELLHELCPALRWNHCTRHGLTALAIAVHLRHYELIRVLLCTGRVDALALHKPGLCVLDMCLLRDEKQGFLKQTLSLAFYLASRGKLATYMRRRLKFFKSDLTSAETLTDAEEDEALLPMRSTLLAVFYMSSFPAVRRAVLHADLLVFLHDNQVGSFYSTLTTLLLMRSFIHGDHEAIVPLLRAGCWGRKKKCGDCQELPIMAGNLLYLLLVKEGHDILIDRLMESEPLCKQFEAISSDCITELFGASAATSLDFLRMAASSERVNKLEQIYLLTPKPSMIDPQAVCNTKEQVLKEVAARRADENMRKLIAEEELIKQRKEARKETQRVKAQKRAEKKAARRLAQLQELEGGRRQAARRLAQLQTGEGNGTRRLQADDGDAGSEEEEEQDEEEQEEEEDQQPTDDGSGDTLSASPTSSMETSVLLNKKEFRKYKKQQSRQALQTLRERQRGNRYQHCTSVLNVPQPLPENSRRTRKNNSAVTEQTPASKHAAGTTDTRGWHSESKRPEKPVEKSHLKDEKHCITGSESARNKSELNSEATNTTDDSKGKKEDTKMRKNGIKNDCGSDNTERSVTGEKTQTDLFEQATPTKSSPNTVGHTDSKHSPAPSKRKEESQMSTCNTEMKEEIIINDKTGNTTIGEIQTTEYRQDISNDTDVSKIVPACDKSQAISKEKKEINELWQSNANTKQSNVTKEELALSAMRQNVRNILPNSSLSFTPKDAVYTGSEVQKRPPGWTKTYANVVHEIQPRDSADSALKTDHTPDATPGNRACQVESRDLANTAKRSDCGWPHLPKANPPASYNSKPEFSFIYEQTDGLENLVKNTSKRPDCCYLGSPKAYPIASCDSKHEISFIYEQSDNLNNLAKNNESESRNENDLALIPIQPEFLEKRNIVPPNLDDYPSLTRQNTTELDMNRRGGKEQMNAPLKTAETHEEQLLADPAILDLRCGVNILEENRNLSWEKPCADKLTPLPAHSAWEKPCADKLSSLPAYSAWEKPCADNLSPLPAHGAWEKPCADKLSPLPAHDARIDEQPAGDADQQADEFFPSHHGASVYPILGEFLFACPTTDNNEVTDLYGPSPYNPQAHAAGVKIDNECNRSEFIQMTEGQNLINQPPPKHPLFKSSTSPNNASYEPESKNPVSPTSQQYAYCAGQPQGSARQRPPPPPPPCQSVPVWPALGPAPKPSSPHYADRPMIQPQNENRVGQVASSSPPKYSLDVSPPTGNRISPVEVSPAPQQILGNGSLVRNPVDTTPSRQYGPGTNPQIGKRVDPAAAMAGLQQMPGTSPKTGSIMDSAATTRSPECSPDMCPQNGNRVDSDPQQPLGTSSMTGGIMGNAVATAAPQQMPGTSPQTGRRFGPVAATSFPKQRPGTSPQAGTSSPQHRAGNSPPAGSRDANRSWAEESGYQSPGVQFSSGEEERPPMAEPPLFVKNWVPRSKRWHHVLSKVAMSPHTDKVGSINLYLRDNSCVLALGSCGTTVTAGIRDDGTEVAVKRIVKSYAPLIRNELQSLRTPDLDHPNIIRYRDYVEDASFAYLALELCECTLEERVLYLASRSQLAPRAPQLCHQLLSGLAALHRANILHMDLKPRNVLVDGKGQLRLADFGLSHRLEDSQSTYYHATMNGTKCWRPPETLRLLPGAMNRYKQASDVYVAGLIVYYIVTGGRHPFGQDATTCELNIQRGARPATAGLRDEVLVDLLHCMLHPDMGCRVAASTALTHPYFWSAVKRWELLVAVGQDRDILKPECALLRAHIDTAMRATCRQDLNWRTVLDEGVLRAAGVALERHYSPSDLLTHILPALDEADPQRLTAALQGGSVAAHVLEAVPRLFMVVYEAVARTPGWLGKRSMRHFFHTAQAP